MASFKDWEISLSQDTLTKHSSGLDSYKHHLVSPGPSQILLCCPETHHHMEQALVFVSGET